MAHKNKMMSLFMDIMKKAYETNDESFIMEEDDDYSVVSFCDQDDLGNLYQISVAIYNDGRIAEIYTRKAVDTSDAYSLLIKCNELNAVYMGVSFYIDEDVITAKSMCEIDNNVDRIMENMFMNINAAHEEFKELK